MNKIVNACTIIIGFIVIIGTLSYCNQSIGQEEIGNVIGSKMKSIREQLPDSTSDAEIAKTYGVKLVPYLEQYRKDISERVRWQADTLLWFVGTKSDSLPDRQQIVDMLVEGIEDKEPLVWQAISDWLLDFKTEDFSTSSKVLLHKLLDDEERCREVILLCGVADMKSELLRFETYLIDESKYETDSHSGRWYGTLSWTARKARSRMGVTEDIRQCIKLIESESDINMRNGVLFNDLQYVRQPKVIPVLLKYLNITEMPPKRDGDTIVLPTSYWSAWALSKMLRGFPVKKDAGLYTQQDIEHCRQWMSEQKEYEIIR